MNARRIEAAVKEKTKEKPKMEPKMKPKRKLIIYIVCFICGICGVIHFVRYYTNSKYNVLPRQCVKQYIEDIYNMDFNVLEEKYYHEKGYHIWEYTCQDGDGFTFWMKYRYSFEEEGPVSPENATYIYIRDGYLVEKIKDQFKDRVAWDPHDEYWMLFQINHVSEIEEAANCIVDIFEFSFGYLERVLRKKSPVICSIYCSELYRGPLSLDEEVFGYKYRTREELYEFVYDRLEQDWVSIHPPAHLRYKRSAVT